MRRVHRASHLLIWVALTLTVLALLLAAWLNAGARPS